MTDTYMADAAFQQAKEQFDRDGFAVIKGFLSGETKRNLLDNVDRYLARVLPGMDSQLVFFEDKNQPETLLYAQSMEQYDSYFKVLLEEGRCRCLAELLLGQAAAPQGASTFNKPPRIGRGTPPHQDAYYWMLEPSEALTLWIAIDDSDRTNGCVRYVRGSHRLGIRRHEPSKEFGFSQKISDYTTNDERGEVAVAIDSGDLIAHHCMTIHRTENNTSDRSRRALGLVYYAKRAKTDQAGREARTKKVKEEWGKRL